MKTLIQRAAGDNIAAEALVDPLCVTEPVCAEKGKAFLYSEGFDVLNYDITIPFRKALSCGEIVEVLDASMGETFRARLAGWQLTATHTTGGAMVVRQTLQLERSLV